MDMSDNIAIDQAGENNAGEKKAVGSNESNPSTSASSIEKSLLHTGAVILRHTPSGRTLPANTVKRMMTRGGNTIHVKLKNPKPADASTGSGPGIAGGHMKPPRIRARREFIPSKRVPMLCEIIKNPEEIMKLAAGKTCVSCNKPARVYPPVGKDVIGRWILKFIPFCNFCW